MPMCSKCGEDKDARGFASHETHCKGGGVAVAERPRSIRGQRRRDSVVLSPLDQIRMAPAGITGSWAYYIRPDGATIRDALILSPNGGIPDMDDQKLRARYGTNATHYRDIEKSKGFTFIGSTLTSENVGLLVQTLASNREDELLYCQEEIEDCEQTLSTSDRPEIRDQAKKRRAQFQKRIDTMLQPFDADALVAELKDIARAQQLAELDPKLLRVMREMVGEVNEKVAAMTSKFQKGKVADVDPEMGGSVAIRSRGDAGAAFEGADFIDAD